MRKSCLTYFAVALFSLGAPGVAHAENYIGLVAGNFGTVSDATVTASQSQLICFTPPCSQTASGTVHFNREHSAGIRAGVWYDTFGLASEYTTSGATSAFASGINSVEVNFDSLSLLVMARTPVLATDYLPDAYLYAGLGISSVYARFSVVAPPLAALSSESTTSGVMLLGGGTLRFSKHVMLFGEWRYQELSFNSSYLGTSMDIPFTVSEVLFGAAYWWE